MSVFEWVLIGLGCWLAVACAALVVLAAVVRAERREEFHPLRDRYRL